MQGDTAATAPAWLCSVFSQRAAISVRCDAHRAQGLCAVSWSSPRDGAAWQRPGELFLQLRFRHLARNVFSNWFATGANMATGFFLAPFIVHHLGNAEYGVWVLAISALPS